MQTSRDTTAGGSFWLGMAILALGVAIGAWADPKSWFDRGAQPGVESVSENVAATADGGDRTAQERDRERDKARDDVAAAEENGLETLELSFDQDATDALARARREALTQGVILSEQKQVVSGELVHAGQRWTIEARLKGDWTDHVESDKWSLRITLVEGKFNGMRAFSVQDPLTRGYLWEWVVHEAGRSLGLLAPRSGFVNVAINGRPNGVYFLEEHFQKELLESQGRREGPIVVWDETTYWSTIVQSHDVLSKEVQLPVPAELEHSLHVGAAPVRAYGEKRLSSIDSLARSLYGAIDEMRALRAFVVANDESESRAARLAALDIVAARSVDELVDTEKLARAHALGSLFQLRHPLIWHNMRFYHDPLTDRLEPILFDNMANVPGGRSPIPLRSFDLTAVFAKNPTYYAGVFRELGVLTRPEWLEELFAELDEDWKRYEKALRGEGNLAPENRIPAMKQRLRTQQAYLAGVAKPRDPVNFAAAYLPEEKAGTPVSLGVEISAWSTTRAPVVIEGFRFGQGNFLPAADVFHSEGEGHSLRLGDGVVLPFDGRRRVFRFPMDQRLANLENVRQIKQAVREQVDPSASLDLGIRVRFRSVAEDAAHEEPLLLRRVEPAWLAEGGRPRAPSLEEALARHSFLSFDTAGRVLSILPGDWRVEGDLVVPNGYALHAEGPLRLAFEEDAVLLSEEPLIFRGTPEAPVQLVPVEGAERWRGICVLAAEGRSEWSHVQVERTDAVARAGWVATGGITFYHSSVTIRDSTIAGTHAEDGLNVFGTDFLLERVRFVGCASDCFDGDFVRGRVVSCVFEDGEADGVDFSGSDVDVVDCRFVRLGDKAVSAGENSEVRIRGGVAEDVSLGIASKDNSRVTARNLTIRRARNYALAAFVKKVEFGGSSLFAFGLTIEEPGLGVAIAQTGCTLEIDGRSVSTEDLDVEQLYKEGVLGR